MSIPCPTFTSFVSPLVPPLLTRAERRREARANGRPGRRTRRRRERAGNLFLVGKFLIFDRLD